MTPARRRLVSLAAVLAPARAASLLGRLGDADAASAAALARELAAAPRHTRLAALAAALPERGPPPTALHPLLARLRVDAESRREGTGHGPSPHTLSPPLSVGEREGSSSRPTSTSTPTSTPTPAAERTMVRAAARPPRSTPAVLE